MGRARTIVADTSTASGTHPKNESYHDSLTTTSASGAGLTVCPTDCPAPPLASSSSLFPQAPTGGTILAKMLGPDHNHHSLPPYLELKANSEAPLGLPHCLCFPAFGVTVLHYACPCLWTLIHQDICTNSSSSFPPNIHMVFSIASLRSFLKCCLNGTTLLNSPDLKL